MCGGGGGRVIIFLYQDFIKCSRPSDQYISVLLCILCRSHQMQVSIFYCLSFPITPIILINHLGHQKNI